jgi:hypothetical protein
LKKVEFIIKEIDEKPDEPTIESNEPISPFLMQLYSLFPKKKIFKEINACGSGELPISNALKSR